MKNIIKIFSLAMVYTQTTYAAVPKDPMAAKVQEINIANNQEPTTFDPHNCHEVACSSILEQIFEGLVNVDQKGVIVPAQAEKWTMSPDGKKYTFTLRKNLKWSDGTKITAQDFVYGMQRLVDPKTASENGYLLENIVNGKDINSGKATPESLGVKALNESTLEITLIRPTAYFLEVMAMISASPVQKKNVEQYGSREFTHAGKLVSNGPFVLKERKIGDKIVLEPNPNYWDKNAVYLNKVNYLILKDLVSEYRMFEAGQLHITGVIPADQYKAIKVKYAEELQSTPILSMYYYIYNLNNPKLQNKSLRKALDMTIDRTAITDSILGTGDIPSYEIVPNGMKNYTQRKPEWTNWTKEKQVLEAKKLYAEAGYSKEKPLKLQILYNTDENHKKIAIAIASMWKKSLGVEVEIANEEWKTLLDKRSTGQFEVLRLGGLATMNDAYDFLTNFQSTSVRNTPKFKNADYDKYIEQAESEVNPVLRKSLQEKAGKILMEELPFSPIMSQTRKYLKRKEVIGFKKNILEKYSFVGVYIKDKKSDLN
ncbi:peptide ABC transporter substrate-binding protein [Fluviispira sanaruensis]|uniref:Peptide ABC transporter substrate-binding protein n=1 Tax=Fluviispira sanaruensis TaxID=2493639 RepID=A0A4P2VTR8_FLUSA|nr:peptide ABC transporter substrate-binding protein [Fluviispira sanaruensis]BBH52805.1 peptide ABC transporter substrate-binding protein [Fluviispira sanaruensis]